mmetsp:Transcript_23539/g.56278  ORF Transcript_23539/g.56278 Transcript_23539/m.56278 type:complete len:262 (-) Transcript_23539:658-1443(-)
MQHSAMAKDIDKLGINPYGLQQPSRQRQERAEERRPVPKVPPGFEPSGSGKHRAAAAAPPPPPPPPRATHGSSQRHSSSSHAAASSSRAGPKADLRRVPIVLVPAASSAKINMFNARSFLEEGAFKTAEQCKAEGVQRAPLLSIKRTVDRKAPVEYHVTDKLPPKHSSEWQRVVAVFVHGVTWQVRCAPRQPRCPLPRPPLGILLWAAGQGPCCPPHPPSSAASSDKRSLQMRKPPAAAARPSFHSPRCWPRQSMSGPVWG